VQTITTREAWLQAALTRITKGWPVGADLPENVRVSVGFPVNARGRGAGRITEHHAARESTGGFVEIFVSPTVADAATVARALAHEAALVALNRPARGAEVAMIEGRAERAVATLPAYPHDAMSGPRRVGSAGIVADAAGGETAAPGPGSRLIRVRCPECGYTLRAARRWLTVTVPCCPADAGHGTMHVG
jgi:hypothetical protein